MKFAQSINRKKNKTARIDELSVGETFKIKGQRGIFVLTDEEDENFGVCLRLSPEISLGRIFRAEFDDIAFLIEIENVTNWQYVIE